MKEKKRRVAKGGREKGEKEEHRELESGTVSHVEVDRQTGCPISLEITFCVPIRRATGRKGANRGGGGGSRERQTVSSHR